MVIKISTTKLRIDISCYKNLGRGIFQYAFSGPRDKKYEFPANDVHSAVTMLKHYQMMYLNSINPNSHRSQNWDIRILLRRLEDRVDMKE